MGFCCEGLKSLTTCWTINLLQESFRTPERTQSYYWFRLERSMKHYHLKNKKLQFVTALWILAWKLILGSRSEISYVYYLEAFEV
jgi:hypothetical protein